jgi:2,3-bisphosphoglycerate-dependent phosphoglycerate mutase
MTVRLCLVRHGATAWSETGRLTGWTDLPLSPRGRAEARALRSRLEGRRFVAVWSSDLTRAVETAQIAASPPMKDRRLRELDFGELEGMGWNDLLPEMRRALLTFDGFQAPGGESLDQLRCRVAEFVTGLVPGEHLVVTHGGVARLLLRNAGSDQVLGPASVGEVTIDL